MSPWQYDPTKIWTTLLTNRAYFCGALVLNHTLRKTGSRYQLKIMVTRDVEADTEFMEAFSVAGIPTIVVDKIEPTPQNGKVNKGTWEKLAPWGMTEYERIVLLDSDQIIRQNIDDLMTMDLPDGYIAAVHACTCNPRQLPHYSKDWTPQNCAFTSANPLTGEPAPITPQSHTNHNLLNSGTVVLQPSKDQYQTLIDTMNTHPDVPNMLFFDQDLLAIIYKNKWTPLPYTYNALKPMRSCHSDLWKDGDVKVLHYILDKPWKKRSWDESDLVEGTHGLWWDQFGEVEAEWTGTGTVRAGGGAGTKGSGGSSGYERSRGGGGAGTKGTGGSSGYEEGESFDEDDDDDDERQGLLEALSGYERSRGGGGAGTKGTGGSSGYEKEGRFDAVDVDKKRLWEAVVVPFVAQE